MLSPTTECCDHHLLEGFVCVSPGPRDGPSPHQQDYGAFVQRLCALLVYLHPVIRGRCHIEKAYSDPSRAHLGALWGDQDGLPDNPAHVGGWRKCHVWPGECVGATGSTGTLCGMTERGRTSSRISGDSGLLLEEKGVTAGGDLLLS